MRSFLYAFRGIGKVLRSERNFRTMFVCFLLVTAAGFVFGITPSEWVVVLLCSGAVLSLEMVNTAIESLTDLAAKNERHPLAEKAKDIAAGAVLLLCVASLIIGVVVFAPYVFRLFRL